MLVARLRLVLDLFNVLVGPSANLLRTLLLGVLGYVSLIMALRVSGKRTLSKLNAFDLVVTVALGSCLATTLLSNDTSLLQGTLAFGVLIGLQFAVAWLSVRSRFVSGLVKAAPTLVYYRGEVLQEALRRERLTPEELEAAARSAGLGALTDAQGIVLETDGTLSVLREGTAEPRGVRVEAERGRAPRETAEP